MSYTGVAREALGRTERKRRGRLVSRRLVEQDACELCGEQLEAGKVAVWDRQTRRTFCGTVCAAKMILRQEV